MWKTFGAKRVKFVTFCILQSFTKGGMIALKELIWKFVVTNKYEYLRSRYFFYRDLTMS